jgi:hypothetical protein
MAQRSAAWISSLLSRPDPTKEKLLEPFNDSRDKHDWCALHGAHFFESLTKYRRLDGVIDARFMDPVVEAKLLPHVPSLLSTKLPPCGLELQVSYQNVLHRLRRIWLHFAAHDSTVPSLLDVCKVVKLHIEREHFSQPFGTGACMPWRRANVFKFEFKWAMYFVREAEVMERWPRMNAGQRDRQEHAYRLFLVPKELGLVVRKENKDAVMGLWKEWNEEKRADMFKQDKEEDQAWQQVEKLDLEKEMEGAEKEGKEDEGKKDEGKEDKGKKDEVNEHEGHA